MEHCFVDYSGQGHCASDADGWELPWVSTSPIDYHQCCLDDVAALVLWICPVEAVVVCVAVVVPSAVETRAVVFAKLPPIASWIDHGAFLPQAESVSDDDVDD